MKKLLMAIAISGLITSTASKAEVTIPNIFQADTPAIADQVNDNFDALKFAVEETSGVAIADTRNSSIRLTSADATVRSVTLIPPRDGNLVFVFQAWFTCTSAAACVARCSINPGGSTLDTSRFAITSVASGQYQTMSISGGLPATENNSMTLNAVCDTFAGTGSLGDPSLIAIFNANSM